jgi:hypothetical protein
MRSLCLVFVLLVTSSLTFCQSIPNCKEYSQSGSCSWCDPGYVIAKNSSGLYSCYGCSPGCQSCQDAGATKCDTCSQGYTLLNSSQTCSPCAANCAKCDVTGGGQCDPGSCQSGYYQDISDNYLCKSCSPYCQTCNSSLNNCTSCPWGITLNQMNFCEYPSNGLIIGVIVGVFGLLFTIVGVFLGYRKGKSLSEDVKQGHSSVTSNPMLAS